MPKFTVWVQEADHTGTIHISVHEAGTKDEAAIDAVNETLQDWGDSFTPDDVIVVGIAAGDVEILEWNDDC